jgi:starch phosphorylase
MVAYGASFEVALEAVASSTVFTTHTPVPAGIDLFPPDLIEKYFSGYMSRMGLSTDDLLDLGREDPTDKRSAFSMAVLAIRLSRGCNGVSELHGHVSRKMFRKLWPNVDEEDTPIGHVTNGTHIPSYVSQEMADLIVRYLGEGWVEEPDNKRIWARMQNVPHAELWAVHETRRDRLVAFCRQRLVKQIQARGGSRLDIRRASEVLNPEALTIGFARRFAPYKRAWLLFSDPERLHAMINDKSRPVQFIFAGKAHPRDNFGKEIIQKVVLQARQEGFRNKLVFLEDYDINLARYMLQGVDVWLNNPRRPMEACGTSGMKAAANGALNVSILDGWWAEAYHEGIGWAIGKGEEFQDQDLQDRVDAQYLYSIFEENVIPTFFDRGPDGHPHRWIQMMKNTMAYCAGEFNSHRMVEDYLEKFYIQAGLAHQILGEKRMSQSREFVNWKHRMRELWKDLKVLDIQAPHGAQISLGQDLLVEADIHLGDLREEELVVDLCYGRIDPETDKVMTREVATMWPEPEASGGARKYAGTIPCKETGIYAYNLRILPFHPYLFNPLSMNLMLWV